MNRYIVMILTGMFMMMIIPIISFSFLMINYYPDKIYAVPMAIIFSIGLPIMVIGIVKTKEEKGVIHHE